MSTDYKFYSIYRIYKEDDTIMIDAFEMITSQTMLFKFSSKTYSIPHIFHSKIEYKLCTLNVDTIGEKVIFLPEFMQMIPHLIHQMVL